MDIKRDIVYGFLSMDVPSREQLLLGMEVLGQGDFADITDPTKRFVVAFQRLKEKDEDFILRFKANIDRHLQRPNFDFDRWKGFTFQSQGRKAEAGAHYYARGGDCLFVIMKDEPSMGMYRNQYVTEHRSLKTDEVTGVTIANVTQLMRDARPTFEQAGTEEFRVREQLMSAFGQEDLELSLNEIVRSLNERDTRIARGYELCDKLEKSIEGLGVQGEPAKDWIEKIRVALSGGKA